MRISFGYCFIPRYSAGLQSIVLYHGFISAAKVLSQLTLLEIKGYGRRDAGKRISLNLIRK